MNHEIFKNFFVDIHLIRNFKVITKAHFFLSYFCSEWKSLRICLLLGDAILNLELQIKSIWRDHLSNELYSVAAVWSGWQRSRVMAARQAIPIRETPSKPVLIHFVPSVPRGEISQIDKLLLLNSWGKNLPRCQIHLCGIIKGKSEFTVCQPFVAKRPENQERKIMGIISIPCSRN